MQKEIQTAVNCQILGIVHIHRLDPQTFDHNLGDQAETYENYDSIDNDLVVNGDVEKHLQGAAACISRW